MTPKEILNYSKKFAYAFAHSKNLSSLRDDLWGVAQISAISSLKNYDESLMPIKKYLNCKMRQGIIDFLRKEDMLPTHKRRMFNKLQTIVNVLTKDLKRDPTFKEISDFSNIPPDKVEALMIGVTVFSLDGESRKVEHGLKRGNPFAGGSLLDSLARENLFENAISFERACIQSDIIKKVYSKLTKFRHKKVFDLILEGHKISEIAEELGFTVGRVTQISNEIKSKFYEANKEGTI